MRDVYPSTKGLSVYNAVSQSGRDMTADEILGYLRAVWDPKLGPEYVTDGVEFLAQRALVKLDGEKVCMKKRGPNGKGQLLVRVDEDRGLKMLPHWTP